VNGSFVEKLDPVLKFNNHLSSPAGSALSKSNSEQSRLAHFVENRGFTLEFASATEAKLPLLKHNHKLRQHPCTLQEELEEGELATLPTEAIKDQQLNV
jgi:hypothetical protein